MRTSYHGWSSRFQGTGKYRKYRSYAVEVLRPGHAGAQWVVDRDFRPGERLVGPRNAREELLAEIWGAVLGREEVGIDEGFFAAGGDSILAIRLLARMRQSGLDLSLEELFEHPTIAELARLVGRGVEESPAVAAGPFSLLSAAERERLPAGLEDAYPLTRMQAGMLFHSELEPETAIYHDIFSNHVRAPLDVAAWRHAIGIEERLGVKLPLAVLLREATVEGLARLLSDQPSGFSPLVAIQPRGSRRPFFCVHPGGGHVLCYSELAHHLGEDQPFYG